MIGAGELDDRRSRDLPCRAIQGREESPDTTLRQQSGCEPSARSQGNAPGNARGCREISPGTARRSAPRKVPQKTNRRGRARVTGGRETCSSSFKSPFAG